MYVPVPLLHTLVASQMALPVKTAPKSRVVVKRPLATPTARLVTVPPTWLPPVGALDRENWKS